MKKGALILTTLMSILPVTACERSVGSDPTPDAGNINNNNPQPDAEVIVPGTLTYRVDHRAFPLPTRQPLAHIAKLDLTASAHEWARVTSLTFKLKGEVSPEAILEVWLYHELPFEFYADTVTWNGDYVTFDLSSNPIMVPPSMTEIFTIRVLGDFDPCVNTIAFDVEHDWHITATGVDSNQPMNIVEHFQSTSGTPVPILGENITFSLSPDNPPAGYVYPGADDHEYIRFRASPQLDLQVQETVIHIYLDAENNANYYSDVKFSWKDPINGWTTVVGPLDLIPGMCPNGFCSIGIMDIYDLGSCMEYEFKVTMDVSSGAPIGSTASVTIPTSHLNFFDVDNDIFLPEENILGGDLHGNPQEVVF